MANKSGRLPGRSIKSKEKGTRTASGSSAKSSSSAKKGSSAGKKASSAAKNTKKPQTEKKAQLTKYQQRKKNRQFRRSAVIAVIALTGALLAFIFLFKIGEIRISGSTRYSKEEIIAASKLKTGENTITADKKGAAEAIPNVLPFIESARVRMKSPTVVQIEVNEAVPAAVYETPDGYILLSSRGKVLKTDAADYIGEVPVIRGVSFASFTVGSTAVYSTDDDFAAEDITRILDELFTASAKYNLDIRSVDWTKSITMKLNYAETLIIDLGYPEDIDRKLLAARCFIDERLEEGEKGILRISDPDNMSFTFDPNNSALTTDAPSTELPDGGGLPEETESESEPENTEKTDPETAE